MPREEIEELSVPDCGLTSVGVREEAFGDYRVRVEVKGSDVEVNWFDGKGKSLKSVPAPVKKEHAEDWKDLQGDIKDLQAMISAQKERIDGLFLEQKTGLPAYGASGTSTTRWWARSAKADLVRGRRGRDNDRRPSAGSRARRPLPLPMLRRLLCGILPAEASKRWWRGGDASNRAAWCSRSSRRTAKSTC